MKMNFTSAPLTPDQQLTEAIQEVLDRNVPSPGAYDAEDSLYELTRKLPDKETVNRMIEQGSWFDLNLKDVELLRELSDRAGGWAHARDGKLVFVDLATWKRIHDPVNRPQRHKG
jgi:hypothetical protein